MPLLKEILIHRMLLAASSSNSHYKPDVPGKPEVVVDEDGNVTEYENTEEVTISGDECVDTEFLPFDGKNWELHINALFVAADQTQEYPTLLCCMSSTSPWPGITIRYEDTQMYIIVNGNNSSRNYYKTSTDSNGIVDIYITYTDGLMTITNNGTTIVSGLSITISLDDISLTLGADVNSETGEVRRQAVCTIYEFNIKKTE